MFLIIIQYEDIRGIILHALQFNGHGSDIRIDFGGVDIIEKPCVNFIIANIFRTREGTRHIGFHDQTGTSV